MTGFFPRCAALLAVLLASATAIAESPCQWLPEAVSATWESFYAGMPLADESFTGPIRVLDNIGFEIGFSDSRRAPLWVCYRLFDAPDCAVPDRPSLISDPRVLGRTTTDFCYESGSKLQKGHMAPNAWIARCYGPEAQRQAAFMTNICAQRADMHEGPWTAVQDQIAADVYTWGQVWVICGAVFDSNAVLGSNLFPCASGGEGEQPHVPDRFYVIFVHEETQEPNVSAYLIPQTAPRSALTTDFETSVDAVEQATHLDFFWMMEDELESAVEADSSGRTADEVPLASQASGVVICAVLANAEGSDEVRNEAIFLFNAGNAPVDLTGLVLSDTTHSWAITATGPVPAIVSPGQVWATRGCIYNTGGTPNTGIALSNDGENLTLSWGTSKDEWKYRRASAEKEIIIRAGYEYLADQLRQAYEGLVCP